MKKNIRMILSAGIMSLILLTACGNAEKEQGAPTEVAKEEYQCPMKCTEAIVNKPGDCPVCGMELEKITKS